MLKASCKLLFTWCPRRSPCGWKQRTPASIPEFQRNHTSAAERGFCEGLFSPASRLHLAQNAGASLHPLPCTAPAILVAGVGLGICIFTPLHHLSRESADLSLKNASSEPPWSTPFGPALRQEEGTHCHPGPRLQREK